MSMRQVFPAMLILAMLLGLAAFAVAQDDATVDVEVVYSATKTPQAVDECTTSTTVITRDDIEKSNAQNVYELLKSVPGVTVMQQGSPGGAAAVFVRGGNSNHTLVLVDGIKINSPAQGAADLSDFSLDQIQRVEIVRGAMSNLYGSDAVSGVIQIFTAPGAQIDDNISLGAGNAGNRKASFAWGEGEGETGLSFAGSYYTTDGFHFDNDDYDGLTVSGRYDTRFAGGLLTWTARYFDCEKGNAGDPPALNPDANYRISKDGILSGLSWNRDTESAHQRFQVSYFDTSIDSNNPGDYAGDLSYYFGTIDTTTTGVEFQQDWYVGDDTYTLGAEWLQRKANMSSTSDDWMNPGTPSTSSFDKSNDNKAVYGEAQKRCGNLNVILGARYDDNENYGSDLNWSAGVSQVYNGGDSRWWANYGTAFKAPTLNDLYYPGFSNPALQPEESKSWEIGLSNKAGEATTQLVYFHNEFDNLIAFDPVLYVPSNIAQAQTSGFELSYTAPLAEKWNQELAITRLNTWTSSTTPLLRRPRYTASYTLGYSGEKTSAQIELLAVGSRYDVDGYGYAKVSRYYTANVSATHQLNADGAELWLRIENAIDRDYEAINDYPSPGVNFVAGVRYPL